jgi:hypothetical protein
MLASKNRYLQVPWWDLTRGILTEILQRHLGQTRAAADAVFFNQLAGAPYLNVLR